MEDKQTVFTIVCSSLRRDVDERGGGRRGRKEGRRGEGKRKRKGGNRSGKRSKE